LSRFYVKKMNSQFWREQTVSLKRVLILCCLLLALSGCSSSSKGDDAREKKPRLRILFIGNSYTSVNDLPHLLAELAKAGGDEVETDIAAPGGFTLSAHLHSSQTLEKIKSVKWDWVVLQEQSQISSVEQFRTKTMYPAAVSLVKKVKETGATPIFFETWAHRDGWKECGLPDYESMQLEIDRGYMGIAQKLKVSVAPVGYAWLQVRRQDPQLDLWQQDGSHPNQAGTYLAACVIYAAIYHQSPEGLTYRADLSSETAQLLQASAAKTVLNPLEQGNLP
jgi:hypothetical protein